MWYNMKNMFPVMILNYHKKIHGKSCNHRLQLLPNLFALGVAISPIIFKYGELGSEQLSNQIFLSVQANKLDDLQQY